MEDGSQKSEGKTKETVTGREVQFCILQSHFRLYFTRSKSAGVTVMSRQKPVCKRV
jgi:hypothetical protein